MLLRALQNWDQVSKLPCVIYQFVVPGTFLVLLKVDSSTQSGLKCTHNSWKRLSINVKVKLKFDVKENAEFNLQIDAYLPSDYISDERQKIEIYKRIREIENQKDYQDLQDELIDRFGEYPDQVAYLIEIGLVKAYLDAAFAELVERKNDTIIVRFEKASLKFFLTQDYFEAISKTHLKAKISDNQGKVEITFDVRNKKDYEILEELKIFGQTFMEIKERKEKKEA